MIKRKILVLFMFLVVILIGGCGKEERFTGPDEKITIGATNQELSTLIWIAEEKGYFKKNGLNATVKGYDTGIETKNALFKGEVDVADTVDFVISGLGLEKADIRVLASIDRAFIDYIIARKDKGILSLRKLKNKRVGIKPGSSAEYYLGRTLLFNDLSLKDIKLVPVHPPEMPEAIERGDVDATITWHPHNYRIKNRLGDNAISWSAHNGQSAHWIIFSKNEFIQKNPEKIKRLLNALIQAEEFLKTNNLKGKKIIAEKVNLDLDYIESVWSDFDFKVTLQQDMILIMEDQARWRIENKLTDKTEVPNYLEYIYQDALKEIKPEAVTIIG